MSHFHHKGAQIKLVQMFTFPNIMRCLNSAPNIWCESVTWALGPKMVYKQLKWLYCTKGLMQGSCGKGGWEAVRETGNSSRICICAWQWMTKIYQGHCKWWQRSIPDTVLCWNKTNGHWSLTYQPLLEIPMLSICVLWFLELSGLGKSPSVFITFTVKLCHISMHYCKGILFP